MTGADSMASPELLSSAFRELTAGAPEGIWAAPGRVNLIGEHTDYNDGLVLPFALPHHTAVAAGRRDDSVLRVRSLNSAETLTIALEDLVPGAVSGWGSYVAAMVWSLRESGRSVSGVDIVLGTSVPQGAGLSSSAALECAVGIATAELYGHQMPPLEMAKLAQRAENDFVGMPCGLMDQMISMLGQPGHAVLFDTRTLTPSPVPLALAGAQILVVDTRAPHRLVDGEYAARRAQCATAAQLLGLTSLRELNDDDAASLDQVLTALEDDVLVRRVRHVVTENRRVLQTVDALGRGDLATAGELLNASHQSLRDDYEVTVPEVDLAQEVLSSSGAYGARITGGGFGGCVIALVPEDAVQPLITDITAAYAGAGFSTPTAFTAEPAAGARRVS
ncbi:galactokinase [Nesterenkonia rhizosphaerae]|uniref:Galactokinase n=1 Tax=Nesterenkonia rhizosphaerae TaxID=1348272 RepID=A0ABP9FRR2_9MICC